MTEYSLNTKIRIQVYVFSLIIFIILGVIVSVLFNQTSIYEYKDNTLFIIVNLLITPSVLGVHGLFLYIFSKTLWKVKWINKFLSIPNLNGVWKVSGKSSYKDTEFSGEITIYQTFYKIKVKAKFENSVSVSSSALLKVDEDGSFELSYYYGNIPSNGSKKTMNMHDGFGILKNNNDDLSGEYFTNRFRGNTGTMALTKELGAKDNDSND